MSLLAKAVVKNKCWIVEDNGKKVAAILSGPAGVTFVHNQRREKYASFKLLKDRYNIIVDSNKPTKSPAKEHAVYGYPTDFKPYNELWDVQHKLPVCTKQNKSKSYYCAGYYLVKLGSQWTGEFCPKFITVSRYPYHGPYKTQQELLDNLAILNKDKGNV